MNRRFNIILLGVAVVASALSCAREEIDFVEPIEPQQIQEDNGVRTVTFRALETTTKAQFGEPTNGSYPTLWTANDSEVKLSLNYGGALTAGVTPSQDYTTATFSASVDFNKASAPYTFYAVSPASAAQALSPSREAWKVSIPCKQTPTSGSVDEAGIIIAASSAEFSQETSVNVVDMQFEHLTAYGRMSLSNLALASGETVQSVELTATTPLVGDWYWKCADGHQLTDYGASSTITITTTSTSNIWFACAPVTVSEEALVVRVFTNQGVFEQLTAFPTGSKFTAGRAAVFTINMSGADYTANGSGSGSGNFELVTDASTLAVGDEVLIVCTGKGKALGAISDNGNYRNPVDVTISNNAIASVGNATVLTLCSGTPSGTFAFQDGSNYLASASSGNYLQNISSVTDNSSWEITIESGGLATIQAQSGGSKYMLYNNSSPRFTCYDSASKSGMTRLSIYRRSSGGGASTSDAMLLKSEYGCYLGTGNEWIYNPGTEQVSRSYDSAGVETYTLIGPSEIEGLEIAGFKKSFVKGDDVTVSVHWRKGNAILLESSYPMHVIKEEGPKVWLGDGSGKGFIIKK